MGWRYHYEAASVLRDIFSSMKNRLMLVKHRFNLTAEGVHIQQRLTGCEVLGDGQPAVIMFTDSSDGQDADSRMYNMMHFTNASGDRWEIQWSTMKRMHFQMLYSNIYLPFCVRTLYHLVDYEKRQVAHRVRPRVCFITKPVMGGAQVTCLATDFYPRHINLTPLNNRPVHDSELTGGLVLPNGNGFYQVRTKMMVGDEELKKKHNYTCTASHLSLDNRLEVS
ncbi:class I histocompatibility antigen, F10 alpha chain [Dicentrarchus labrax]|uniref:class I histocompatibility antigen, F10 alpha chain n=1 Tax=Dicentrarchus labrax TaxID=13489 RepID=UPI0021F5A80B|nr:class I histocompatibility antigen, F10 alpha chain [Dicentrarchus labrax]